MIPLKNPICGVASIFQPMRRMLSTAHSRKISRLAPACRQAGLGVLSGIMFRAFCSVIRDKKTDRVIPAKAGILCLFKTFRDLDTGSSPA